MKKIKYINPRLYPLSEWQAFRAALQDFSEKVSIAMCNAISKFLKSMENLKKIHEEQKRR